MHQCSPTPLPYISPLPRSEWEAVQTRRDEGIGNYPLSHPRFFHFGKEERSREVNPAPPLLTPTLTLTLNPNLNHPFLESGVPSPQPFPLHTPLFPPPAVRPPGDGPPALGLRPGPAPPRPPLPRHFPPPVPEPPTGDLFPCVHGPHVFLNFRWKSFYNFCIPFFKNYIYFIYYVHYYINISFLGGDPLAPQPMDG